MERNCELYQTYVQILNETLIPAMGCTEPISIAYAAAKAKELLDDIPNKMIISVSGNIVKNVKSVIVPNTHGKKGIEVAAAAGVIFGKSEKLMEVISEVTAQDYKWLDYFLKTVDVQVTMLDSDDLLDVKIELYSDEKQALVRVAGEHTRIVRMEKDHEILFRAEREEVEEKVHTDKSKLNIDDILDFADTVAIEDIEQVLEQQIQCNCAISDEGLKGNYGAQIGKTYLEIYGEENVAFRAAAKAAAGSDARMNGCDMPVVINSGSGNQGMTVSLPVVEYANEIGASREELLRALVVSNLTAIRIKTGIGVLSAYCGAVSAGAACGAGIAYLYKSDREIIEETIANALAITSGIICDGAKASCAAKIATAVEAGIFGFRMAGKNRNFQPGDGIVKQSVEETIQSVSRLGSEGMRETDHVILNIMTER